MREKKSPEVSPAEIPTGAEIPAQPINPSGNPPESPTETPPQTDIANPAPFVQPAAIPELVSIPPRNRKFSPLQLALIAVVSLSATLLTYSLISSKHGLLQLTNATQATSLAVEIKETESQQKDVNQPATQSVKPQTSQTEPLSLQMAENYYTAKNYDTAYNAYERLRENLVARDFELVRDFLQLRKAQCLEKKGSFDQACELLKEVCESRSPALKAIANYRSALIEMDSGQYLKARTRAYRTIALTAALASDSGWTQAMERDCYFLAAEGLTRQVLSLCDADKDMPHRSWSHEEEADPLTGLNEVELQAVLNRGIEQFNSGLLAPHIQAVESSRAEPQLRRWLVVCNGPGIEELMARFAANASLDVRWMRNPQADAKTEQQNPGWNRSITLYLPAATTQQVITTAAGSVGLLAEVNEAAIVTITNPAEYVSLSEHTRLLNDNALWLWNKLLLMYSGDKRIQNVHFILGVLHGQRGRVAEAIAEYKLVINRYSQTPFAPFALLRSSNLKMSLRDYAGATQDLKQLIDEYPDNELTWQAHLNLAETTMKAGHYDQACALYRKANTLSPSAESRNIAAFGAARCLYEMKDYESAVKWLTQYIEGINAQRQSSATSAKTQPQGSSDLYTAYLLLGKAHLALGNLQQAYEALESTLRRAAASDEYAEAISALVDVQIKRGDYVTALNTIENVSAWPLSQEQLTKLAILKCRVLRTIGLTDQATTLLSERVQYLIEPHLKAAIIIELARCYGAAQNPELARTNFTEALSLLEPGPLAQEVSLELAEVCLKLNDHRQAVSICTKLLNSSCSEQTKQQASKIIAAAYSKQQEYDKAALALLTAPVLPDTTKPNTDRK